uniref:Uncharacterized protein n=1 Tax=Timema genevievae TaxID=629358 RepID=A0A7R9JPZ6_TIMGE|nr:unnamed protein product [Timema genevievae]
MVQFRSVAQSTCGVRFRQLTRSTARACALSSQRVISENGRQTSVPTKRDRLKGVRQLTMDVHETSPRHDIAIEWSPSDGDIEARSRLGVLRLKIITAQSYLSGWCNQLIKSWERGRFKVRIVP